MSSLLLASDQLNSLFSSLQKAGYQVVGPTLQDQAIVYDHIQSEKDLPQGWGDEQEKGFYRVKDRADNAYFGYNTGPIAWKKFLHLPKRQIWQATKTDSGIEFKTNEETITPLAFLGVRSCDLHAIRIQDGIFISEQHPNQDYQQRREAALIIGLNCTTAAATCFCTTMNTGPAISSACDLEMTEVFSNNEHYFLLRSDSPKGQAILEQLPVQAATTKQLNVADQAIQQTQQQIESSSRGFDNSTVKSLLYNNYDSPVWDDIADRCLSCANCTMVCPTCFCSTVEDSTDITGEHSERWEQWDSCFTGDFTQMHGGDTRPTTQSRYRQWMTHKLATWHDQFDESGCVGCGRCIAWCPVGIDITEEVVRIQEAADDA